MQINRVWSMPNRWTFNIKPVKELLMNEITDKSGWVDPFAGHNGHLYSEYTNDILDSGMDGLTFLQNFASNSVNGVVYDPPYSITQARKYGKTIFASMKYWADCKNEISRIIKPNGKAICFGWNSMGLGKNRGFEMTRVLIVPHGGSRNDTIVTVETKMTDLFSLQ